MYVCNTSVDVKWGRGNLLKWCWRKEKRKKNWEKKTTAMKHEANNKSHRMEILNGIIWGKKWTKRLCEINIR